MTNGILKDKRVVITGASQGLGEALVRRFLGEGARVLAGDIQDEALRKTAEGMASEAGTRLRIVKCDVTNEDDVAQMVGSAVADWGGLDIFVANAGILMAESIIEFDAAKWRKVIDVNLVGQMLCMKHSLRVMQQAGSGSFIQINSKSGKKGSFKNSAYAASKFGGIGLVQSAALEMAASGVRVNAVCPGNLLDSPLWVNSLFKQYARNQGVSEEEIRQRYIDQVPMKRSCRYEDVCNVVVFLASDLAGYMTGQAINVTGGQEMR
ncbi:MAG: sorbitol-6-phosphate dehydrogenase [Kiritimatiellia bacterium]|nr:sorbitol-6-phosphate dehydrogenase [Lentisphaerota bacterium]